MKIPTLETGQVIQLVWHDTQSELGWLYNPKRKREPRPIYSIGFVVQLGEKILTISTSLDGQGASLDELSIPLGCIQELTVLPDEWHLKKGAKQ